MIDIDRFKALNDTPRPRDRRRGPARGRRRDRRGRPRRRRPGALRRRGVRRPAAQPDAARSRSTSASASAPRSPRSTCDGSASGRSASRSGSPSRVTPTSRSTTLIAAGRPGALPGEAGRAGQGRRRLNRVVGRPDARYHPADDPRRDRMTRPRADQRRPRADLPRDRRHARGQGRARLQDGRLPPGGRRHRSQPGRRRRRPTAPATRPRSRASARRSATRSSSSRRPGTWPTTTGSAPRSRRASSSCCASPGSGPRPSASSTRELGVQTVEDLRNAAEDGRLREPARACRRRPRRSSSRASPSSTTGSTGCCSTAPRTNLTAMIDALAGDARRHLDRAGRLVPPPEGDDRRPRPPRRDRPAEGADRRVHLVRRSSIRSSTRAATRRPSG